MKNEGEFVSVEQGQKLGDKRKQREDNIRQLLDVTNTITSEEIRDFEMRYGKKRNHIYTSIDANKAINKIFKFF